MSEGHAAPPKLSIIIVNWNTRDLLADCLKSVYETVHDVAFEVFVVDNASSDGSAAMVRERFPSVHLIENDENVGFARANNQAIRESAGEYVLLLNSDTVLLDRAVTRLCGDLDRSPYVAAAGPRLLNGDWSVQHYPCRTLRLDNLLILLWRLPGYRAFWRGAEEAGGICFVERIKGACLMIRRDALAAVGVLDEGYDLYCEEDDWCIRATRSQWHLLYDPAAEVIHLGGSSSGQTRPLSRARLYRSRVRYLRLHHGSISAKVYRLAVYVSYSTRELQRRLQRRAAEDARSEYWEVLRAMKDSR